MKSRDDSLQRLMKDVLQFRDAREWKQFHNFKDLAITLCLESAELLEHTQWKSEKELANYLQSHKEHVADELCDVLHMVLLLAEHAKIDLPTAFARKMKKNEAKYPVHKAKGTSKKYTDL
jgi:dCTP diphosphatase